MPADLSGLGCPCCATTVVLLPPDRKRKQEAPDNDDGDDPPDKDQYKRKLRCLIGMMQRNPEERWSCPLRDVQYLLQTADDPDPKGGLGESFAGPCVGEEPKQSPDSAQGA